MPRQRKRDAVLRLLRGEELGRVRSVAVTTLSGWRDTFLAGGEASLATRPRHPPTQDTAGEDVDDEGHVNEALPGCHVGEVRFRCILVEPP